MDRSAALRSNNEFGRPAVLGYFRSFEHADGGALARGYHKPVMLAGGIGAIPPGPCRQGRRCRRARR